MLQRNVSLAQTESNLWSAYRAGHHDSDRNALALFYNEFAKFVASAVYVKFKSSTVEWNDCLQNAQLGVLEAIEMYKPGIGIQFRTFAVKRVRGAVLNGIGISSEYFQNARYRRELESERIAAIVESTKQLDPLEKAIDTTIDLAFSIILDRIENIEEEDLTELNHFQIRQYKANHRVIEKEVSILVEQLPELQSKVIFYHYYCELSFIEIAKSLSLSKSRVSQIHAKAMHGLRNSYEHEESLRLTI